MPALVVSLHNAVFHVVLVCFFIAVTLTTTHAQNMAPSFPSSETGTRSVDENTDAGTNIGSPVTASDPENDELTYSLGGGDAVSFDIVTSTGQLQTKDALDYEDKSTYTVVVSVSDGKDVNGNPDTSVDDEITVAVTVNNDDDPGNVSLSGQRRVGTVLRARLSDPDGGVHSVTWSWARSSDEANWTNISDFGTDRDLDTGRTSSRTPGHDYAPTDSDRGMYLRATATYTDAEGSSKSAEFVSDNVVGDRESAPDISVVELASGLTTPWDIAFTTDGTMLFTQFRGVLSSLLADGTVQTITADLSDLFVGRTTGLMSIVVDPNFVSNRRFYTCQGHTGPEVQVIAWTINSTYTGATRADDPLVEDILTQSNGAHGGGRIRFGPEGYLWIAAGDAGTGTVPQDLGSLGGKILRVDAATGQGATGNPFDSSPLVYTSGHRNPQGLARRPGKSEMWVVEHGPQKDDEINVLVAGGNYGWDPVPIDAGDPQYNELKVPMTDLEKYPGAIEAKWSSGTMTLAHSGGIFLKGADWDDWEGRLAVATLRTQSLRIFEFTDDGTFVSHVVVPELDETYGRLRTPMLGPDGALYVATSNSTSSANGVDKILKVVPSIPPAFPRETHTQEVAENRSTSEIVATVTAADPDGHMLTYKLSGSDAASFNLADDTVGELRVNESFDYETKNSFTVVVTASDKYGLSDDITVTIDVTDVNEAPEFPSTQYIRTVADNTAPGKNIGAPVVATDPEDDALTYTLGGDDGDSFNIITLTGQLRTKGVLDRKNKNTYIVTVSVSDGKDIDGNSDTTMDNTVTVTITVTDVPPPPPPPPPASSSPATTTTSASARSAGSAYGDRCVDDERNVQLDCAER